MSSMCTCASDRFPWDDQVFHPPNGAILRFSFLHNPFSCLAMQLLALAALLAVVVPAWLVFQQPIPSTSTVCVAVVRSFASTGCLLAACCPRALCCSSLLRFVTMWTPWDVYKVRCVLQLCAGAVLAGALTALTGSLLLPSTCRRLCHTLLQIANVQMLCLQACAC